MAGIPWGAIAEAVSVIAAIATNPEALEQVTKAADSAAKAVSAAFSSYLSITSGPQEALPRPRVAASSETTVVVQVLNW